MVTDSDYHKIGDLGSILQLESSDQFRGIFKDKKSQVALRKVVKDSGVLVVRGIILSDIIQLTHDSRSSNLRYVLDDGNEHKLDIEPRLGRDPSDVNYRETEFPHSDTFYEDGLLFMFKYGLKEGEPKTFFARSSQILPKYFRYLEDLEKRIKEFRVDLTPSDQILDIYRENYNEALQVSFPIGPLFKHTSELVDRKKGDLLSAITIFKELSERVEGNEILQNKLVADFSRILALYLPSTEDFLNSIQGSPEAYAHDWKDQDIVITPTSSRIFHYKETVMGDGPITPILRGRMRFDERIRESNWYH